MVSQEGGSPMQKKFSVLQKIDYDRQITREEDTPFLYHLQKALLLALREQGRLHPMEHRQAEEALNRQRRERIGNMQDCP